MPQLEVVNFNIVCATLGGFITLFGLVSYLCKEKFYLSEALISTIAGVVFSPHATNFIKPLQYANNNEQDLETVTLYFARLVLDVQLVLAGVQLPSKYLKKEWKSLTYLLGPGMCAMWIVTSLLVWALVPNIPFVYALAVGSCCTPTDPVLSNGIVKGKFADKNIPQQLQRIVIAESGANDGLGYPFLYLALYIIKFTYSDGAGTTGGAGKAIGLWFGETWGYTILLSVVYGAVVGWLAKELLHWAEERHYVDRESFLVFAITLALFIAGTVGMIGSDDVLASFIAGNTFTWDDWFRLETMDDSLQPTIDMLLNVSIFLWLGAVCPWHKFVDNDIVPIYRLIALGILVLLFRRLPMVMVYHKLHVVHQLEDVKHAFFVGFFGPIGISALFYLYISRQFLSEIVVDGQTRPDAQRLADIIEIVVWFLIICSIVVHGLSIPLGKLGFYLPRTISTAMSSERASASQSIARDEEEEGDEPRDLHIREHARRGLQALGLETQESRQRERAPGVAIHRRLTSRDNDSQSTALSSATWFPRTLLRAGKHMLNDIQRPHGQTTKEQARSESETDKGESDDHLNDLRGGRPEISLPRDGRPLGHAVPRSVPRLSIEDDRPGRKVASVDELSSGAQTPSPDRPQTRVPTPVGRYTRSIQFADEPAGLRTPNIGSPRKGSPAGSPRRTE